MNNTDVEVEGPDPAEELAAIELEYRRRQRIRLIEDSIAPVFKPFFNPARYKGAHGGRGSAKSWSFARLVIARCLRRPGTRVVCIREIQKTLGQSVKRLLEDTIKAFGLEDKFRILAYCIETPGDGIIIFQGMQEHTADSIKSLEGFDIAWVEEAQSLSDRSLTLLRPTIRKENSELWFTWNPRNATDPVDKLLRSAKPPGSMVVQANYRDNPHLPKVLQDELEWDQKRDPEKYAHVWLGEYEKHSNSRVFKNWRIDEFETPDDAIFYFGGDWGYSVDPTVLVRCYLVGKILYIDRECYRIGCEIDHIADLFDGVACGCDYSSPRPCTNQGVHAMAREWTITADSARPETISYLQRHGYPKIEAAIKGANSVKEGVIFLQGYDIVVHPSCIHTIDELTMYSYKVDQLTGNVTPILQDKKNHVIDSLRYAVEKLRQPEQQEEWCSW